MQTSRWRRAVAQRGSTNSPLWVPSRSGSPAVIAERLNADLLAHPPPTPVDATRAAGRWTTSSVREVLTNPKHTGHMVWKPTGTQGRRPQPPQPGGGAGVVTTPVHQALVGLETFVRAQQVAEAERYREGVRVPLSQVPVTAAQLSRLPDELSRPLFDALHLRVRYDGRTGDAVCRIVLPFAITNDAPHRTPKSEARVVRRGGAKSSSSRRWRGCWPGWRTERAARHRRDRDRRPPRTEPSRRSAPPEQPVWQSVTEVLAASNPVWFEPAHVANGSQNRCGTPLTCGNAPCGHAADER